MLNTARQGACRIRQADTATAAACTAMAGPRPQASRIANVKQIDGKTAELWRRPGGVNGRASQTTASAAITQNDGRQVGQLLRQAGQRDSAEQGGHRDDRPDEPEERQRALGGNGVPLRCGLHTTSPAVRARTLDRAAASRSTKRSHLMSVMGYEARIGRSRN